jgi:hypothetical protein
MATKITGTNTAAAPGVTGDDTDTGLFYGTNEIGFSTGGTSRMTLDSSGKVGIGTAPSELFHIKKDDTTGPSITLENSANKVWLNNWGSGAASGRTNRLEINASLTSSLALAAPYISLQTGGAGDSYERLRIDSSGYVGLKLTDPSTYYAKDLVIGCIDQGGITLKSSSTSDTQYLMFADGTSGNERYRGYIGYQHNTGSGGGEHLQLAASGSMVLRVDSDGLKFGSDTAAVNALSDYEEGNYTVTLDGQTGGDYTLNGSYDQLAYTKVGRVIHISGRVRITAKNNPTGDYIKMNLPTTSASLGEDRGRVTGTVYVQYSNKAVNDFIVLPTIEGNSYVQLAHVDYDGTGFNNMNSQFSGDELISINITYVSA